VCAEAAASAGRRAASRPQLALWPTVCVDEDRFYIRKSPYKPRRMLETVQSNGSRTHLEEVSRKRDVWHAALLGMLTGAAIVIAWIVLILRVCL